MPNPPHFKKKILMFDKQGIFKRFAACYPADTIAELARTIGVHHSTVFQWRSGKNPIPWLRLKTLVDEQGISWDWLIDGVEPQRHSHTKNTFPRPLDRHAINQRFLSLFPGMSQAKVAKELGINQTTVFKWEHSISQVPWERLRYAVSTKGVTWEWLLEGRRCSETL